MLKLYKKTSTQLDRIEKKYEEFEVMLNEQKDKIEEIWSNHETTQVEVKKKEKGKRSRNEFYHVSICFNTITMPMLFINLDLYYRIQSEVYHTSCSTLTNSSVIMNLKLVY